MLGLGTNPVTVTVTDAAGKATNREVTLTVEDETAPEITNCAGNRQVVAGSDGQAVLPDLTGEVGARDCNGPVTSRRHPRRGRRWTWGCT